MAKILIISDSPQLNELKSWLIGRGFTAEAIAGDDDILDVLTQLSPGLAIVLIANFSRANNISRIIKQETKVPVLMLVSRESVSRAKLPVHADDFCIYPAGDEETDLRIKRLLPGNDATGHPEQIRAGDLVIDTASCEVSLNGEILELTYREYELIKFLASNRGRTFTREALLNRVWGYDYFGGDRTVDVHIRRLRTKTGDLEHPYIETVRNIGYRFRKQD